MADSTESVSANTDKEIDDIDGNEVLNSNLKRLKLTLIQCVAKNVVDTLPKMVSAYYPDSTTNCQVQGFRNQKIIWIAI